MDVEVVVAVTIGSNISSLKAQGQLGKSSDSLSTSLERLSSGQRINRASDDAAGLSISTSLEAQGRVQTKAISNVNDAISLVNVASGALEQLTTVATRLQELSEQAANGVYSAKQRDALNKEALALTKEYNRIVEGTQINNLTLLDNSLRDLAIQAGVGNNGVLNFNLGNALGVAVGKGTFSSSITIAFNAGPQLAQGMIAGDFNGDGKQDFMVEEYAIGQFFIYSQNSSGGFSLTQNMASGIGQVFDGKSVDIDGDGDLDIVAATDGQLAIFKNSGNGTFAHEVTYASGTGATTSLELVDVNGDGYLDALTSHNYSGSQQGSLRLGNGDGTFKAATLLASYTQAIAAGDINSDGKVDYLAFDAIGGTTSIFTGNGNGTFAFKSLLATGNAANDLQLTDINGDKILDAIWTTASGVSAAFGNGDGTFGSSSALTSVTKTIFLNNRMKFVDMNGDGALDLTYGSGSGSQNVFLNNGKGTFTQSASYAVTSGAISSSVADFNNDGIPDIISTGNGANPAFGQLNYGDAAAQKWTKIYDVDLTSQQGARSALSYTSQVMTRISSEVAALGSFQSRLLVANSTLRVSTEQYAAARSRIVDVDVASESANLMRSQILQQTGASILAQANIQPELALKLLKQ